MKSKLSAVLVAAGCVLLGTSLAASAGSITTIGFQQDAGAIQQGRSGVT